MMRVVEHIEGNKKIDNLYVVNNGVEYATTFVKLNDLYRVSIRYGINRVFDILNDVEVLIKEYDDDVSLNDFMTTLNMELDFLTDKEIDDFFKMKEEKNIKQNKNITGDDHYSNYSAPAAKTVNTKEVLIC